MKWSEMPKKQRDLLILKVMGGALVVIATVLFGIKPFLAGQSSRRAELAQMESQVQAAEMDLRREARLEVELAGLVNGLTNALASWLPPEDNPFLWASTRLYDYARQSATTIDSISEVPFSPQEWIRKEEPRKVVRASTTEEPEAAEAEKKSPLWRRFALYRVQVSARGDFRHLVRFLRLIEADNPWMAVSSLTVSGNEQKPTEQVAVMVLEWPRHVGPLDEAVTRSRVAKTPAGAKGTKP